jgi:hypothetical protein
MNIRSRFFQLPHAATHGEENNRFFRFFVANTKTWSVTEFTGDTRTTDVTLRCIYSSQVLYAEWNRNGYGTITCSSSWGRFLNLAAGKHVNGIRVIAKQPPVTIEELSEVVFSVGSAPTLHIEDPRPAEWVQLRDIRRKETTWAREAEKLCC